jgi:hypothetical protein
MRHGFVLLSSLLLIFAASFIILSESAFIHYSLERTFRYYQSTQAYYDDISAIAYQRWQKTQ